MAQITLEGFYTFTPNVDIELEPIKAKVSMAYFGNGGLKVFDSRLPLNFDIPKFLANTPYLIYVKEAIELDGSVGAVEGGVSSEELTTLQTQIDSLNSTVSTKNSEIVSLNSTLNNIELVFRGERLSATAFDNIPSDVLNGYDKNSIYFDFSGQNADLDYMIGSDKDFGGVYFNLDSSNNLFKMIDKSDNSTISIFPIDKYVLFRLDDNSFVMLVFDSYDGGCFGLDRFSDYDAVLNEVYNLNDEEI